MAVNGVYIVQGELNAVVAQLRRGQRWQPLLDEQDPLLRSFADLREVLNTVADLADMSPSTFLTPFLEVIRSEQTSGVVTGQALAAVGKFLSYGLIDCDSLAAPSAVQRIADAVTHARFVGTDAGSDEVVLLRILQVLRALLLTPVGALLTDEAVCEVLQSCFRICFERRLSELLRKAAESCLTDMVQLLFTRLPTFVEDPRHPYIRRLKMRAGFKDGQGKKKIKRRKESESAEMKSSPTPEGTSNIEDKEANALAVECLEAVLENTVQDAANQLNMERRESLAKVVDVHENLGFASDEDGGAPSLPISRAESSVVLAPSSADPASQETAQNDVTVPEFNESTGVGDESMQSIINERGVKFTTDVERPTVDDELTVGGGLLQGPYGLPCIRELLRFLISISNPIESQNTENMMELGLNLLIVALEAGADYLGNYSLLLPLIQNELCKNAALMLLTPKLNLFAATLRVGFLCFEALRTHLKFQLESYLTRLMELVLSDAGATTTSSARGPGSAMVERKELALEALVQLWRVPGLVTELYLNYDCDLYCSNLFEELTKLLSKNAFPVAGLTSTHVLSLDALLTVVDTIETNCHNRMLNYKEKSANEDAGGTNVDDKSTKFQSPSHMLPMASGFSAGKILSKSVATTDPNTLSHSNAEVVELLQLPQVRPNRMPISPSIPSHEDLIAQKQKKKLLTTGTELFNQNPAKGVSFLQEHGLLRAPLVPKDLVNWLRENPRLDKRKIAEYIVNRKNTKTLEAFVQSFDFNNIRLDEALRLFLETFRLPGEAAEIAMVIEHFSDHWHKSNGNPFASVDAAFTLAYAVIMLNVDQHNPMAKRQQQPMTMEAFKKNLNGVNGGQNFEPTLLEEIYKAICNDEIIMPAEQTGNVKENYLWKLLLRRGQGIEGRFIHAPSGLYDHDLFVLVWGPTVAALSYVFDKSTDDSVISKAVSGYRKCAAVAAHYGMSDVFDNLIINLCKFSTLLSGSSMEYPEHLGVEFGDNLKAQLAAKAMFQLVHSHGDILREGWRNLSECLLQLFRAKLLPDYLTQVEDFSSPKGWISIVRTTKSKKPKSDAGIFSSLYNYLGGGTGADGKDGSSMEEQKFIKISRDVVAECRPEQLVYDSKYLTSDALSELLKALVVTSAALTADSARGTPLSESLESSMVFYLESIIGVCVENRDRLAPYWRTIRTHMFSILSDYPDNSFLIERAVVGLLRLAARLLIREEIIDEVISSLGMLMTLRMSSLVVLSRQIAFGMHELLRSNAANIHKKEHWAILFVLLEAAGAAAFPAELENPKEQQFLKPLDTFHDTDDISRSTEFEEGSDKGYTSDSELYSTSASASKLPKRPGSSLGADSRTGSGEWLYVDHKGSLLPGGGDSQPKQGCGAILILKHRLRHHDPRAFIKCCETLAFLVRDAAHVTPENFESCVQCLRTFVEASLNGGCHDSQMKKEENVKDTSKKRRTTNKNSKTDQQSATGVKNESDPASEPVDAAKQLSNMYLQVSLQLLDLVHTLHIKAAAIHQSWAEASAMTIDASPSAVWYGCWRPLLQALARLCCDQRKQVRTAAQTYLQRALLVHDLQALTASDWEDCCWQVLFPLLSALIEEPTSADDALGLDEARVRATTLMSKVFLQHLGPLSTIPTFCKLWTTILDFMEKYLHLNSGDLNESIPESVKNMLLVMETAGLFKYDAHLAKVTKEKLAIFLPHLAETVKIDAQVEQKPVAEIVREPNHPATEPVHPPELNHPSEFNHPPELSHPSEFNHPPGYMQPTEQPISTTSPTIDDYVNLEEVVVVQQDLTSISSFQSSPPRPRVNREPPALFAGQMVDMSSGGAQVFLHPPAGEP